MQIRSQTGSTLKHDVTSCLTRYERKINAGQLLILSLQKYYSLRANTSSTLSQVNETPLLNKHIYMAAKFFKKKKKSDKYGPLN